MGKIISHFNIESLDGDSNRKTALLINPPVYDTQYWAEWSQPYGLLRIAALLKKNSYKRIELFDFMEADENRTVHRHRINPDECYFDQDNPSKTKSITISKNGSELNLFKHHFGKTWQQFYKWIDAHGYLENPPDEVWITSIMSYWWESTRDLTIRLKNLFAKNTTIILGGIYPTLVPDHASLNTRADIVVIGDVEEANDLWIDLSLYERTPQYAILTPSRGCPFNCSYCAQKTLNMGSQKVRFRSYADVLCEMKDKYDGYGIRDFAFYSDFLLWDFENNFQKILESIVNEKLPFRLYAPEGLDTRFLSSSQKLVDLLKAAHFQKIYLPVESIDDQYLKLLNRRHVKLEHFVKAVKMCENAGFRLRHMEINSFVLYGLPEEKIEQVVRTIVFVSEIVGSIIPMLFTPVPSTRIFNQYLPYFSERGWDKELHQLNGKLYPFLEMNEGSLEDYVDLQRLMYMLNSNFRSKSFQLFGNTKVSTAFRSNLTDNYESFINQYKVMDDTTDYPKLLRNVGNA